MSSSPDKDRKEISDKGSRPDRTAEEAQEIVRALSGGEIDAVVVEQEGQHELMALASLTDLDEITELVRALRSGEVDAFVTTDGDSEKIFSVTPIHDVLAQQHNLTKSITDNATTALFILDSDQNCVFMNPAAEKLTGFSFDEVRGRGTSLHELIHHTRPDGSPYPLSECPIDRAFPTQSQMRGEEVFVHRDGHFYEVAFAASPIKEVSGQVVGTVIEVRDITERKAIELALRDADRRKDEFIATLAHELRNPLAPISNLLAVMKGSETDAELVRSSLETIERQLAKMVRLVDDLLDVSRISRNSIELKLEPIELSSAFRDVLVVCSPMIEQHGHSFDLKLPDEPVYLNADPARISQILCNLINNACKFTPNKGSIHLKAERRNGDVEIKVRDSGVGIPRDQLDRIFDMFAQVGGPMKDARGGLGIGLALAKQLIEMHGGSITGYSEGEGTGTEFVVRLPAMQQLPVRRPRAESQTDLPAGRRILVVDDNFDSAESMATLLSMSGNECEMAHDGTIAIQIAETFKPDVILLDIGLPGINGFEVCRTIREKPWGPGIHIIAMTGWGQPEDLQRSKEAGFDDHLVKPIDLSKLSVLIGAVPRSASSEEFWG